MSNKAKYYLGIADYFSLAVRLITKDLIIHKHLNHLTAVGMNTINLNLELYLEIFQLAGIPEENISEELKEWYFNQSDRALLIDVNDKEAILLLASEILRGLNEFIVNRKINVLKK